jgi:hypothetical protein
LSHYSGQTGSYLGHFRAFIGGDILPFAKEAKTDQTMPVNLAAIFILTSWLYHMEAMGQSLVIAGAPERAYS